MNHKPSQPIDIGDIVSDPKTGGLDLPGEAKIGDIVSDPKTGGLDLPGC